MYVKSRDVICRLKGVTSVICSLKVVTSVICTFNRHDERYMCVKRRDKHV